MYFLRFLYYPVFYFLIPIFLIALFYRFKFYKYPFYSYPLSNFLQKKGFGFGSKYKKVFFVLRALTLLLLVVLIARPQWVDSSSKVKVEGIDIALAIDVSGSMQVFDDLKDKRSRIDVAKEEAVRFIEKRSNDPIGIVIFAQSAISRCPITLDKNVLKEIVQDLKIGIINEAGTSLGTGLATAINRLRSSKAKSRVIILLTDGVPTPQTDKVSPQMALEMAKKLGIKVYTIGIGNQQGGYVYGAFGNLMSAGIPIDMKLLGTIATQTGGKSFCAQNSKEMRDVYNTIDKLEKTKIETSIFQNCHEAYEFLLWGILLLLFLEIILRLFIWRGISC